MQPSRWVQKVQPALARVGVSTRDVYERIPLNFLMSDIGPTGLDETNARTLENPKRDVTRPHYRFSVLKGSPHGEANSASPYMRHPALSHQPSDNWP